MPIFSPLHFSPSFATKRRQTGEGERERDSRRLAVFVTNNIEYRDGFREENTSKKTRSRSRRQKIGGGKKRGLRNDEGNSPPKAARETSPNGMARRVGSKVAYRSSLLLFFPFGRVIVSAFQFRAERDLDKNATRRANEHLSAGTRFRRVTLLLAGISIPRTRSELLLAYGVGTKVLPLLLVQFQKLYR